MKILIVLGVMIMCLPFINWLGPRQALAESYDPFQQVDTVTYAQPLATNSFQPVAALSLKVSSLPNPCHDGCGYDYHSCTWWVALWREQLGLPVGDNWHDAKDWAANAKAQGIELLDKPVDNAIAVDTAGQWGHVMLVEHVNADGSFLVKEGNWDWQGSVRERIIPSPAGLTFIYY